MATPLLVAAVADAVCPPSLPPPWQARCGYITRGGRGGWRSARAAVSLSNSPSSRGGCAEPAGENWVSTGLGAGGRRGSPARGRGRGGRASGLRERGAGWAPRELPGVPVSHRSPSPAESPAPLIAGRRCPPRAGYRAAPRFFWGANVPGRAEPSRGGCQNTPAPSFLHACPPPGAGSEFLGSPEFTRSQPMGGGAGRPLHSHRDRGWGGLFSCGGISCWGWRGPSSGGLSRYGAIICWLQLFSPLVTGPVWAAGHVLESPRVPGAIGEWGRCLSLSLHRG